MNSLKTFLLFIVTSILFALVIGSVWLSYVPDYRYDRQFAYTWNLADKSSTLEAKAEYVTKFVETIETNRQFFADYNAVWLGTPDNSFEQNLTALKTLRTRLNEIKGMDPNSFQYQAAIQQITGQEQGEAWHMLGTLRGCWILENHPFAWKWIAILLLLTDIVWLILTLFCWAFYLDSRAGQPYTRTYRG